MLEARFASLNPFMQYMFLKLHDIEDLEKKAFILETLRIEFRDVVIEAREVFKRFNKLGSPVEVVGTPNDFRVPIPCKLAGIHDAWEKNSRWICPENPFDESSVQFLVPAILCISFGPPISCAYAPGYIQI
jgi:hypothetical protein